MSKFTQFSLLLIATATLVSANPSQERPSQPVVQLPEYKVKGLAYTYEHEGKPFTTHAYLSMPYAQPPVGDLRLERPKALQENNRLTINGTELPRGCTQQEPMTNLVSENDAATVYPVSEDCLYMNVLAPSKPSTDPKGYPVLVWIHGGGFVYGMNRFYGWQQLARHFNPRGVIVVAIQYRVAFWGFFSLGDGKMGNLGLWDQTAALKFLSTHIKQFGGNPQSVTVWGNSAGGASVHSLVISPHSNKYFHKAIESSGSLYNFWPTTRKTYNFSRTIANAVGCPQKEHKQLKACLKKVSVQDIWKASAPYGKMRLHMNTMWWTPVVEEEFYQNKSISALTKLAPKKPTIYGLVKGDGLIFTLLTGAPVTSVFADKLGYYLNQTGSYTQKDFNKYINNYMGAPDMAKQKRDYVVKLFQDYYMRPREKDESPVNFWFKRFTETQNDGHFFGGVFHEIAEKLDMGWDQYLYFMDYLHPTHRNLTGIDPTYTPHAYEYQYLTDCVPYWPFNKSETNNVEKRFTDRLVNGFTQFVKTGNPEYKGNAWPRIKDDIKLSYLQIGEQIRTDDSYFVKIAQLWKKIYNTGYGWDS